MPTFIKAIIFDLDGVIIDSNPAIEAFWKSWAEREKLPLNDTLIREWIHGRKVADTLYGIFGSLSETRKEEIAASAHIFDQTMKPLALPGLVEFVGKLTVSGIPIGIVTSSHYDRMWQMLANIGIARNFNYFITAHDVLKGKPDPEPYLKMSEKMQIEPAHCLVFEDANSGIQSATAAGMHSIGIGDDTAIPALKKWGADFVVNNFENLSISNGLLQIQEQPYYQLTSF
ncbi:MAG: hypothetical protein RLZZ28_2321 [Bacteroidota bacterium]|jgi:sugar-phosphatase